MKRWYLQFATALMVFTSAISAQAIEPAVPIREGVGSEIVKRVPPKYPSYALETGKEGWVLVEFTIEPDGSTSNPVVLDADPPRIFNSAAKKSILNWRYRPSDPERGMASKRDKVVLTFEIEQHFPKLSGKFKGILSNAERAIENGDLEKAKELAKTLPANEKSRSLGMFHRHYLNSRIAIAEGDVHQAYITLRIAIRIADNLFTDKTMKNLYRTLFALEFEASQFAAAVRTFEKLKEIEKLDPDDPILISYNQLIEVLDSPQPIQFYGSIIENCTSCGEPTPQWQQSIYRNSFVVRNASSQIEEIYVSCKNYWAVYNFTDPILVTLRPNLEACQVRIRAPIGTTFEVIELWADR